MTATTQSALRVRRVGIDTWRENVAYVHRDCPVVRAAGFQALSKVEIRANGQMILAVLNVVDDERIVSACDLGLSEDAFTRLGVVEGHSAQIAHAEPAASIAALRRKINGERLGKDELAAIIRDVADARYSKIELAAFVVATNQYELDREEVLHLTEAMIAVGRRLDWHKQVGAGLVVDKHCIGGIPGNRTSMLVVPIVSAHGMWCPKTSSRAITSPSGTADTMEMLAQVELSVDRMVHIVKDTHACLAWGGTADLSPADDILISVERPLSIDSPGQMVASILSKKIAAGSTHLVLDIPVGPSAKVRSMVEAQRLKKLFEYVAGHLRLQLDVVLSDGRQPIGSGIGPVLEARDVMQVLQGDPAAPQDLRQKALRLAGRMIEFDPDVRGGEGYTIARDILDSGRALAQMNAIIDAQGRRAEMPALGALSVEVLAPAEGLVVAIDNLRIARIARLAGAPQVPGAGMDLLKKLGDPVRAGEPLYRIYAQYQADLQFAQAHAEKESAYRIGSTEQLPHEFAMAGAMFSL
ncbi:thymidine phosphorylase family protein [Paucibacter sp. Y2R2-4]|uniref:thymidine phosphorylase family protein n=1 Tax=Paucibacter sp. Y2R2-4 TaxID=2893553 RepID=UPI0021E44EFD|nr:thymidine phosphorylase family protein [Paucibacter sp. Y2R2-4]MCV2349795.1 thymidine phosphorylase family protein [Paucibacter sp. Y2R2-4]